MIYLNKGTNGPHTIYLRDMTYLITPRNQERYARPYWVQVKLWGDDDSLLTKEFDTLDEARSAWEDAMTAPDPNFEDFE